MLKYAKRKVGQLFHEVVGFDATLFVCGTGVVLRWYMRRHRTSRTSRREMVRHVA